MADGEGEVIGYHPKMRHLPSKLINVPTAWEGCESVILDLIHDFRIYPGKALEFGVDYGYSTGALANYFRSVTGIDTFIGDIHAGERDSTLMSQAVSNLSIFDNIYLYAIDYRDWILLDNNHYDLIHIDIIHTFEDTYACGMWAINHSDVVIFHDTLSFPDVGRAVRTIAEESGRFAYNWEYKHGLGIISDREVRE